MRRALLERRAARLRPSRQALRNRRSRVRRRRRRRAPHRCRIVIARNLACITSSISPRLVVPRGIRASRRGSSKLDTFSIHDSSRVPPEQKFNFFPALSPRVPSDAGRPTDRETSRLVYRDENRHQFKNGTVWVPTSVARVTRVARARHSSTHRVATHASLVASPRIARSFTRARARSRARSRGILRVHRGVVRARSTRRDALAIVDDARRFTLRAFTRVRGLERALARRRTATSIGRPFDRQRLGRSRRGRSPRTEGTLLKFD